MHRTDSIETPPILNVNSKIISRPACMPVVHLDKDCTTSSVVMTNTTVVGVITQSWWLPPSRGNQGCASVANE
jgi:hypothetical protein